MIQNNYFQIFYFVTTNKLDMILLSVKTITQY